MSLPFLRSSKLERVQWRGLTVVLAVVMASAPASAVEKSPKAKEAKADVLRVCSDPNNLPFSNEQREGFENELAELVASAMGRKGVEYYWHPQRRGFARRTLKKGNCDVIMGVPASYEFAAPTSPYYRSTYVFVYPKGADFEISSIDDPDLKNLQVGVHMVGDDYSNTPGAEALGRRGMIENIVGYSIYGDYGKPHPPSRLIEAVAAGEVDVAIAWGPLAGYFAPRQNVALEVVPVEAEVKPRAVPFTFNIAMAVRPDDHALKAQLDQVIASHSGEIRAVLEQYGVPLLEPTEPPQESGDDR